MSNYEYAQATDEQIAEWGWAAYQADQEEAYEKSVRNWYAARGLANIY